MEPAPMGRVKAAFDETFDEAAASFPDLGTVELYEDENAGRNNGAGSERQFAYCQDGNPISIAFAPKAEALPDSRLRGLMRHEFGHALEYRYGVRELEKRLGRKLPEQVERRADVIAETVWGEPIKYDSRDIQCVGSRGQRPRPRRLPDEKAKLRANPAGDTVTLPAGSLLFHGSIEPFDAPLRPGGDGVLWFADTPAIAQLYIPCSGITLYMSAESLGRPTTDPGTQAVQRFVGIHYDYDGVAFDSTGRATSWYPPEDFESTPTKAEAVTLLREAGFEVEDRFEPRTQVNLFFDEDSNYQVVPPGECREGRLFVARTTRDMRIYVMSEGEGDLTQVQYNELEFFEELARQGFDGVLIDDFAQTEEWGNLGHLSLGLFRDAAPDLEVDAVPAQYREFEMGRPATPEYPTEVESYLGKLQRGF